MRLFVEPSVEVLMLAVEDVIAASTSTGAPETEEDEWA